MAKIMLADATLIQLVNFAAVGMGLEVPEKPKPTEASVRALLSSAGFTGTEIEVEDAVATITRPALTPDQVKGRKTVRINIPVQEHIGGGDHPVPIGVNGSVNLVMRGVDVDVPAEYVEVLRHAVRQIPVKDKDSTIIGWTSVPIYPFSIVAIVE